VQKSQRHSPSSARAGENAVEWNLVLLVDGTGLKWFSPRTQALLAEVGPPVRWWDGMGHQFCILQLGKAQRHASTHPAWCRGRGTGIALPPSPPPSPFRAGWGAGSGGGSVSSPTLMPLLLLFPPVNTDTETAVVNVTYATKEEAKV